MGDAEAHKFLQTLMGDLTKLQVIMVPPFDTGRAIC